MQSVFLPYRTAASNAFTARDCPVPFGWFLVLPLAHFPFIAAFS